MDASTAEIITAVGTMLGGIGAIGLLAVASKGFDTWREQLIGHDEYGVAKRLIKALLEIKRYTAFVQVRLFIGDSLVDAASLRLQYNQLVEVIRDVSAEATILWGIEWIDDNIGELEADLIRLTHDSDSETGFKRRQSIIERADKLIERLRKFALKTHGVVENRP